MSNAIPGFKKKFALSLLSASLLIGLPGQTSATEMSGVATEVTALVNAASNAATLIEEALTQYNTYMTQINTYKQMFENLKKLPEDIQKQLGKPYKDQIKALTDLKDSTFDLKKSAEEAYAMLQSRQKDITASGKSPIEYLKYEVALAEKKGGTYKKKLDQDLKAMDDMKAKATELRKVADSASKITGNVQGLQLLSSLSAMVAGELMEIKGLALAQSAAYNADKLSAEQAIKQQKENEIARETADEELKKSYGTVKLKLPNPTLTK